MSLVRRVLVVLACSVVGAVLPSAANGDVWRPINTSCVRVVALGSCVPTTNTGGLWNIAVAPGGTTAYATAWDADALLIFNRDPATGRLTQRTGAAGCMSEDAVGGCTRAFGLHQPDGVVVSADGRSVYVASWDGNAGGGTTGALSVFRRDPASGSLTPVNCFSANRASNGFALRCALGRGLFGARDVQLSADQRTVYAGPAGAIATFARDVSAAATHGNLTQLASTAGCIAETDTAGCDTANGLGTNGRQFALSADGASLYAGNSSLAILKRNTGETDHGALNQDSGASNCFATTSSTGCTVQTKLAGAVAFLVGPGDRQVYASTADGVLAFTRQPSGQLALQSCINDRANNGCSAAAKMVRGLTYLALSPDGEDLIADVDSAPAGIVMLSRDPATGNLSQRTGTVDVCVSTNGTAFDNGAVTGTGTAGCTLNPAIAGDGHILFADNNVFHVGVYDPNPAGAILTFKRDFPPVCPNHTVSVTRDTSLAVPFDCSDRNGDALTYSIVANPLAGNLGAIDQAAARVFYNPFGGFVGADSFKFRALASPLTSADATVTVNVVPPPDTPADPGPSGPVLVAGGIDADHDGFFAGQDCNDANVAIRPGALEIKGNRLDENCDGIAEPFPTLTSGVVHNWSFKKSSPSFTLKVLSITQQLPKGISVTIKCSGKKCPLRSKTLKLPKAKNNALNVFPSLTSKQRKFRAGQTVEVWISAPNFNTKVARIALKKGKQPVIEPLCVAPGDTTPKKSCA
jgi:DNA-binding beta-propeller fold protein YncE